MKRVSKADARKLLLKRKNRPELNTEGPEESQ